MQGTNLEMLDIAPSQVTCDSKGAWFSVGFCKCLKVCAVCFGFVMKHSCYVLAEGNYRKLVEGGTTASHADTSRETSNIFHALEITTNKLSDFTCLACGTLTQHDGVLDCL